MYQEDYIMKMIKNMVRAIVNAILNKKEDEIELLNEAEHTEIHLLHEKLISMADRGQINEAENELYKEIDIDDGKHYELALAFYAYINEYEEEYLEEHNYSREEIKEGICNVSDLFGINLGNILMM